MGEPLDIVVPLGQGSRWNNMELLYSLRSIEKHVKNFGRVFVVGQFPDFLNENAIHIAQPVQTGNPAHNIALNLLTACRDERLSETFTYLNDDYFFCQDVDIATYPTYWKCDLHHTVRINTTDYRRHVKSTIEVLTEQGHGTKNFDCHYPSTFNKTLLANVIESNNFNRPFGLTLKSLYFNTLGIEGIFREDCKQVQIKKPEAWRMYARTTEVFSIADTCINNTFKDFMAEMYPQKSRWER